MASNPMQKKTRNAFILGFLVMLIIAIIIGGLIFFLTRNKTKKQANEQKQQTNVYVVTKNIGAGQEVSSSSVTLKAIDNDIIPVNAAFGSKDNVSGYIAKIDIPAGSVLCQSMLTDSEELQDSERIVEYNMLQLPVQLEQGEFIDIRFLLSNGQDYIVTSHKEVVDISGNTVWIKLIEDEINLMSAAIVESYISPASTIYVTKYVEPGLQKSATPTYVPSAEVINLISRNPNVIIDAEDKQSTLAKDLYKKYSSTNVRNEIKTELNKYDAYSKENIEAAMIAAREKAIEARQQYLGNVD